MRGRICSAVLLLSLTACKSVVRNVPISDLYAVSQGNLTLGIVPVENDDSLRAYRLLVCRKSASYPKWMLEDNNRCRHALIAPDGREVVFLQDDLERDFATKYAGHAKGIVMPALVAVAVVGGGTWAIKQNFIASKLEGVRTFFDNVKGKVVKIIPERFKHANIKLNWIETPRARWRYLFNKLQKQGVDIVNRVPGVNIVTDLPRATREQGMIVEQAEELLRLQKTKETLSKMKKLGDDSEAYDKYIEELTAEGHQLNGVESLGFAPGSFLDTAVPIRRQARVAFSASEVADDGIKAMDSYLTGLPKYNDIQRIMYVVGQQANQLDATIAKVDIDINSARAKLDKLKGDRQYSPIAGVQLDALKKAGGIAAAGVGVYALQTMTALDKSIWGYGDRQVSSHWSQVFHEGSLADARGGADIRVILQTLADTFDYRINEEALALGN